MKIKWVVFVVLAAFLILVINPGSEAVNTRNVDLVRNKAVLDNQDLKVIDDFLAEAVRELVNTRDFTDIAKTRTIILSRQSKQGQYAKQFSESARKHIAEGFRMAQKLPRQERVTGVIINLLILMDGLQDLGLADLAISMLKNENMVIRYWAVHCLTNPGFVKQLNAAANSNSSQASVIAGQLNDLIETSSPEIVTMIAQFAASVNIPQGEELLLQIAELRIKRYADWTVQHELYDGAILKYLSTKIPLPSQSPGGPLSTPVNTKPDIARRFAQLYSYAIQKYVKGGQSLTENQRNQLASVLVETEDKCIGMLLNKPQLTIRRAVERMDMQAILAEHDRLLGSENTTGQLPAKFNFDYSTNPTGPRRTAPLTLPDPPQKSQK
jgi:hypothetical protein